MDGNIVSKKRTFKPDNNTSQKKTNNQLLNWQHSTKKKHEGV